MWRKGICAAVLLILPISTVAIGSAAYSVSKMFSPCVGWGGKSPVGVVPKGLCREFSVNSGTRTQALLSAVPVQGVILLAAVLGVWGTARLRQPAVIIAGLVMLLEVIPSFSFAPLAVLAGAGLLVVAYRMEKQTRLPSPS
jgi:hypothetical protein